MSLWPSSLTKGTFRENSHPASHRTVSVNLHPCEPFCSSYYDFLLMHGGGLCDCLAIMALCLINHVDPLCFTSKAAALGLINGDQSPLKRRLVTDSVHLNTQAQQALMAVVLCSTNHAATNYDVIRHLLAILFLCLVRMTCCVIIYVP